MANVLFKRGLHADLPAATAAEDGVFYLTTDTGRLYVGQDKIVNGSTVHDLVELNKSIEVISSASELPTSNVRPGQFFYISGQGGANTNGKDPSKSGGNILAVCTSTGTNGTNPTWVQVNPDTDTNDDHNTHVSNFKIEKDTVNSTSSKVVYKWTITNISDGISEGGTTSTLTGSFDVLASDIASLADAHVSIGSTAVSGGSTTLSTAGNGSESGSGKQVTISQGENVTLSGSANQITINAVDTKYTTSVNGTNKTVSFSETGSSNNVIHTATYAEGNAIDVTVTPSNSNKDATITIAHENVTRTDDAKVTANSTIAFGGSFDIVTGVVSNAQGHVTNVQTREITLPTVDSLAVDNVTANNQGEIVITFNGTDKKSGKDLYFTYGDSEDPTTLYNQGHLSVYTRDEIDGKFKAVDAMVYKGLIPNGGLPTTGVKIGDTYKVGTDGTYAGTAAKAGGMFIARGTEGTDGIITSSTLTWDYISGSVEDTTYNLNVANNIISLANSVDNNTDDVTISGGNKITASTSGRTITLNHDTQTVNGKTTSNRGNQQLTYGQSVSVVNGVNADAYGHVTDIYTSTLTMPAAPPDTTERFSVNGTNKTVTLIEESDAGSEKGTITFNNGNKIEATVVASGTNNKNASVTFNHATLTTTANSSTNGSFIPLEYNNSSKLEVISGITTDAYGHLESYTKKALVLPNEVQNTLSGTVEASGSSGATITLSLDDASENPHNKTGAQAPSFSLTTSSLSISPNATSHAVAVDIVWGSF